MRRILRVKFECGLFENPYTPEVPEGKLYLQPETLALARKVAAESFVLLKNENGLLPLSKKYTSIALVGPYADKNDGLNGAWSGFSKSSESVGIREALTSTLKDGCKINFLKGSNPFSGNVDKEGLRRVAAESDVIVLCIGDDRNGENVSRCSLDLPSVQSQLVDEAVKTGKPVVLLVLSGKPIIINKEVERCAAVMLIWQGGTQAGPAVAEVLTGATAPSGRLSFTWPRHQGQIPIYYSKRRTNRPYSKSNYWTSHYQDQSLDPLYPFGYGLSYAKFEHSAITLSGASLKGANRLIAEVTVTNKSSLPAQETVLWYLSPSHGSITRSIKLLKHFEKRMLAPGEAAVFRFEIDPARDLSYPDARGRTILEAADYTLNINDATQANASGIAKFNYQP